MSWAWWDWPLTWLTNHHPSVPWRCWLGHLTRKIVHEMTYNVSNGTLNSTIPYHTILQVSRLYRALILLGLALSSKHLCIFGVSSVFMVLCVYLKKIFAYILLFTFYRAVPGVIGTWRGWLTIVLQCYDTVGWATWPVKSSTKWPIMCRVGR